MSVLELNGRPFVVFNPEDKEHRFWYHQFVVTGTWGRCPVRFVVPEDHGDLITMIQRSLVRYYVKREFVAKKQQNMITKTGTKRLTSKPKGVTI